MNHITFFAGNPAKHQSFYRLNGKARFFADVKCVLYSVTFCLASSNESAVVMRFRRFLFYECFYIAIINCFKYIR